MSYEPPTQPANRPTKIVNALNESPPEQLRDVAKYAEVLAEHSALNVDYLTLNRPKMAFETV